MSSDPNKDVFDYTTIGNECGVSLKFDLNANDFVNNKPANEVIEEKISSTKWKFHFNDYTNSNTPNQNANVPISSSSSTQFHNNICCWNFDYGFLSPVSKDIDNLKSIHLNDNYTYLLLINWKDINIKNNNNNNNNNNTNQQQNQNNNNNLNNQNTSIQNTTIKANRAIRPWRIPLRARIINKNPNVNNTVATPTQFVDWITLKSPLKSSTTSPISVIGLRTNYYIIEKKVFHSTTTRGIIANINTDKDDKDKDKDKNDANLNAANNVNINQNQNKKATFIGCKYKLKNNELRNEWQLIIITGRKLAYDGPDSCFWIGTKTKSIRKIGAIRASVPNSCLYSIGSDGNSKETKYCSGKIARVMIFDGVLSKRCIQRLYSLIFKISDDKIRPLIAKSQKWYSPKRNYKKRRHSRQHSNSSNASKHNHNNDKKVIITPKKDKIFKFDKNNIDQKDADVPEPITPLSIQSSNTAITPVKTPTSPSDVASLSSSSMSKLKDRQRTSSQSSIIGMDDDLKNKIQKQAQLTGIVDGDEGISSSSSDDDNKSKAKLKKSSKNRNKNVNNKKKDIINDKDNSQSPVAVGLPRNLSTTSLSSISQVTVDDNTHHEHLLPQLEADILEQQKLIKEQKKKDKNNNQTGIMSGIVNKLRQLTATSQPLELENDQNIIKIIPIDHNTKHKHNNQNIAIDNNNKNKLPNDNKSNKSSDNKSKSIGATSKHKDNRKSSKGTLKMPPLRDSVQHVVLYETSHRFFLVGSNQECTKYWILKIDRKVTPNNHLSSSSSSGHGLKKQRSKTLANASNKSKSNKISYKKNKNHKNKKNNKNNMTSPPIANTKNNNMRRGSLRNQQRGRIASNSSDTNSNPRSPYSITSSSSSSSRNNHGRPGLHIVEDRTIYNSSQINTILSMIRAGNKSSGGLTQCISGYGILGFIRFLEGYYIILITDRRKVGKIGNHTIYKIDKTAMIPVTPSSIDNTVSKRLRSDETRYKNLFSVIDLTKEFYFSYTYDLSRTLQWNQCNHFRRKPNHIFVWNEFLLKPLRQSTMSNTWILPIIHGYYESKICSIYGREITLSLISRRSKQFAGTRYLKRGINDLGHSANDIETEQILHDRIGGNYLDGQFTSHVQMRASIPLFWVQDSNPMIPKPDIYIQKVDPSGLSIRKHFLNVFKRYGAPILALNLIKHQESHARETIVGKEFNRLMSFINSFLPKDYKVSYIEWDFKDCQKHNKRSVVDELTKFAEWSLQRTGFFHSNPKYEALSSFGRRTYDISPSDNDVQPVPYNQSDESIKNNINNINNKNNKEREYFNIPESVLLGAFNVPKKSKRRIYDLGCFQKGVLRSNCIDSLDRTNVAQFIVGKCALGYQLYAMGLLDAPWLDRESEFIRILLQMYERMGDCLALQYGGSQMHRQMKKDHAEARSMAPSLMQRDPSAKPKEMFVSFVRHYQNNFQDNVKQDAMNLFLGTFRPDPSVGSYRLWELGSDYYLHNRLVTIYKKPLAPLSESQQWWIQSVLSFNKTFIHCYKYIMYKKTISPPKKVLPLLSNICKSIESAIKHLTTPLIDVKYLSILGITNSYLPINNFYTHLPPISDLFFELAFNPSRLTCFDEEMKLNCNKIERISKRNYYDNSVHSLLQQQMAQNQSNYSHSNLKNNKYHQRDQLIVEKSKISRLGPFLRSKKNKNSIYALKSSSIDDVKVNHLQNNDDLNSDPSKSINLSHYIANISTSSGNYLHQMESDIEDTPPITQQSPPPIIQQQQNFDHNLSLNIHNNIHSTGNQISQPNTVNSKATTPQLNSNNNNNNVLYMDEDMHSQHLPSMTLEAIMKQSYKAYEQPKFKLKSLNKDLNKKKLYQNEFIQPNDNNNNNNLQIPKQLKHSRQQSSSSIMPIPMQFQPVLASTDEIDFDDLSGINTRKRRVNNINIDDNDLLYKTNISSKSNKPRHRTKGKNNTKWKGFFGSFFQPWVITQTLDREKSDPNIIMGNNGNIGTQQINVDQNGYGYNNNIYGQPDIYYTNDIHEQNELALPKNIFADKTDFTLFLNENYGRYELNDYVLSTHQCMIDKTKKNYEMNVNRISVNNNNNNGIVNNDDNKNNDHDTIIESLNSRFKETDVTLTKEDFSAFTTLHDKHLNLHDEIQLIDKDDMKKRGYMFYYNLPQNMCHQSINPKQLTEL